MRPLRCCTVIRSGMFTTIQDLGRPGYAHLGVPRAGAVDLPAHRLANRLVGNDPQAATLETTVDGVAVRFACQAWAAVTGAVAGVSVDGEPACWGLPLLLRPGQSLEISPALHGLRSYLAISGGVAVPPELASRSRDVLADLGPAPLSVGQVLPLGEPVGAPAQLDFAPWPVPARDPVLPVTVGPRADWFSPAALAALLGRSWTVTADLNRIGIRLSGSSLRRVRREELPSEGTVIGAIEVPADGQPLIFLNDHPTTIGYPVIAVVTQAGHAVCAQLCPGDAVRFTAATCPTAVPGTQVG